MKLTSSASFSLSIRISLRLKIHQAQAKNFCRVLDIRVSNVMHPYPLHARCLAAILHFVIQKALGVGKQPIIILQSVAMGHILLQTAAKTVGNRDSTDAFRCFRSGDNILFAEALIALVHRQGLLLEVDVRRCECQQLSLPNPRVVHGHEYSHISLLIDMGFSAVAIADRVRHESIEITYRYAHLFPSKQSEMAKKLDFERSEL